MQREPPRHRGGVAAPLDLSTFDATLEDEEAILDAMLTAHARGQLPPEAWGELHRAAARDGRLSELAFAYESVAQGNRLRALSATIAAELFFQAGTFFADVFGDETGAITYLERALAALPTHTAAFERLDALLEKTKNTKRQAELYVEIAQHRPRAEEIALLRKAVDAFDRVGGAEERVIEILQHLLRLDPADEQTRNHLEARYTRANRLRDVARLLEQAFTVDPPPQGRTARRLHTRLLDLYANQLHEPERTIPHVEALLEEDPSHDEARRVAAKLIVIKGLAARAAAALSRAHEAVGAPAEVARFLQIELEHTRGPKRRDVLKRMGVLRQTRLNDPAGAFEAFEQAILLDANDDELRKRYAELAVQLGRALDGAKILSRVGAVTKDPIQRGLISVETGYLLLEGGETKRAKTTFVAVLGTPDAGPEAMRQAARGLRALFTRENDERGLLDALTRLAELEVDPEPVREVNELLADLAMRAGDTARAIAAYRRLLGTDARAKALAALEPLFEAVGDAADLAAVLEERSKDEADPVEARRLAVRAAEVLTERGEDPAAASAAWRRVVERFGPARDVHARWMPLLEAQREWSELARTLEAEAELAPPEQRAEILAALGDVLLQRLRNVPEAIQAYSRALSFDRGEPTSRAALEKLAALGEHRLAAAVALEPIYRADQDTAALLRTLEIKALLAPTPEDRLTALEEAVAIACHGPSDHARALELAGRGLGEAVADAKPIAPWLERIEELAEEGIAADPRRRASILAKALGDREVDSPELEQLARATGEAYAASGNISAALAAYRRALRYQPTSADLLARVDELLREQGTPEERIAICRAALERDEGPARRKELLYRIASIQRHDLRDAQAAMATYRQALAEDPNDVDAYDALFEMYSERSLWAELCELLEGRLARVTGEDARRTRALLAEVSAARGDTARAKEQCQLLLDDPALGPDELSIVERVADLLGDVDVARRVLHRRAEAADNPREQIMWLERLGHLERDRREDFSAAAEAWRQAARLAEVAQDEGATRQLYGLLRQVAPDDLEAASRLLELHERAGEWSAVPALYAILLEHATDDERRVELLLRAAQVDFEHLGERARATEHVARAFELAPEDPEILATFERYAVEAKAVVSFEQAVGRVLRDRPLPPARRFELLLAQARVLGTDPARADDVSALLRGLLEDGGPEALDDVQRATVLASLEALVERGGDERLADRRWLLRWRASHAAEGELVPALLAWAAAEEATFDDPRQALALHRKVLAIDPECDESIAATARLATKLGEPGTALEALIARRDRSEGAARVALDLQVATLLVDHTSRYEEALGCVTSVLEASPHDAQGLALAVRLLAEPSVRSKAMALLDSVYDSIDDPALRADLLVRLLDAPPDAAGPQARQRWYERLLDAYVAADRRDEAFALALRAARELPTVEALWRRAEELARSAPTTAERSPHVELSELYLEMLGHPLPPEAFLALGERAVAFYEEWFEDPAQVVRILERVLEVDPAAEWAFDRLKLLFDAAERWDDLFALFDRILPTADEARRRELLEEAAQTAKDFAGRPERAVGYLEQLLAMTPGDLSLSSSLERLYERLRRHRDLVTLLGARIAWLSPREARKTRARVATLWLDELQDPAAALAVVEEMLANGDEGPPSGANGVDLLDPSALLEKVLAATAPANGAGPAGLTEVRQRAAGLLKERYLVEGHERDLIRVLGIELEAAQTTEDRVARHQQLAELHTKLGDDAAALEQRVALVMLEPERGEHREHLAGLAVRTGKLDRLAEVLAAAAERCSDDGLRVDLLMQAGIVWADRLDDPERAIALFLRVLDMPSASGDVQLAAARRARPLLESAGSSADRLRVLERLAVLEPELSARREALGTAARLATSLGERERAIVAWQQRLDEDSADLEALDGLIALLEEGRRFKELIDALRCRARAEVTAEQRRVDLTRVARIYGEDLGATDDAIRAWRDVEGEFGESDETIGALVALLEAAGRWKELAEQLERAAARASDAIMQGGLLARLGNIHRDKLGDGEAAVRAYRAALEAHRREAAARDGLRSLLDDDALRPSVVEVLLETYTATDEWRAILELTSQRLRAAPDAEARLQVLRHAAELAETRAEDCGLAFEAMRHAFLIAPDDEFVESELARLARATNAWPAYVTAHRHAIAAREEGEAEATIVAHLYCRMGEVLEARLSDLDAALEAFLHVLGAPPFEPRPAREGAHLTRAAFASIRIAGRLERWDTAAWVVVATASARPEEGASLCAALEEVTQTQAQWDAVTSAMAGALEGRTLDPAVARDLLARLAGWHLNRRGDVPAAEATLERALGFAPTDVELLRSLVDVQRRTKGPALVDSLLRLSEATGGDLALLREAAEVSSLTDDAIRTRTILERLKHLATERWLAAAEGNDTDYPALVKWTLEELTRVHAVLGSHASVVDLLVEAARLPFEPPVSRAMRHEAAAVANEVLHDDERAVHLYAGLFDEDPGDERAAEQLVALYRKLGRAADLLRLRERQIAIADADRRVALRLEASQLLTELGDEARAEEMLRESLRERPRDARTVGALVDALERAGRHSELGELLASQATLANDEGDTAQAAELWARAATIAEERLGDRAAAKHRHEQVVALEPRAFSLDALARLFADDGDAATAAAYLERLLAVAAPENRESITLRLTDALIAAGRTDAARARLEEGVAANPAAEALRDRLAAIYRESSSFKELAELLAVAASYAPDKATRLERLCEAAALFRGPSGLPERAIPLLEQAVDLQPDDQAVRLALADALSAAQRFDEARTLLRTLVESYGGRRPKERAPVHFHLAQLELAMGDRARALVELDAATRIDPANPRILRMLAELARDDGQLERAERSYRALLVVLRRHEDAGAAGIARSEVLLELGTIAERQGEPDRAKEIFESALEAASRNAFEEERLEQALRARGAHELLVRALEAKIARTTDAPQLVRALAALASLLGDELDRPSDALALWLRALSLDPVSDSLHASALAVAQRAHATARYADALTSLAEDAAARGAPHAPALLLRLGAFFESEGHDDARAARVYERALTSGAPAADALWALDRVYERMGDRAKQADVLARLIALGSDDTAVAAQAHYRLAAFRLASPETIDDGCTLLEKALELDAQLDRAADALRRAVAHTPTHERALSLLEKVARDAKDDRLLADALALRAELPHAPASTLREAVTVALALEDRALAERLLDRFVAADSKPAQAPEDLAWALCTLADLRLSAGDVRKAVELKRAAAEVSEPERARALSFEVARLAADPLGDTELAAQTYEALRSSDPADREAWEPLLELYRRTGDDARLSELLAHVVDVVDDPAERSRLRLERVQVMLRTAGREDEASQLLHELVDDDPSNVDAAFLLATLLEKAGRNEELAALLGRQMDAARDRGDAASVASLALRLGALLEASDPIEARNVYYVGLDWEADNRPLLQALLRIHEAAGETSDRADILERLLGLEQGPEAERLALTLHALRLEQWDDAGAERALEMGYRAHPTSSTLRERLETAYRERDEWGKLAALCAVDARARKDVIERVARLREAAALYRTKLDDASTAAALLREACEAAPADATLLTELVTVLTDARDHAAAAEELTRALERGADGDLGRAMLLAQRASVRAELSDHDGALADLEEAFALDPGPYAGPLATQLEQSYEAALRAGDAPRAHQHRLRLVEVFLRTGNREGARDLLSEMIREDPRDREALRRLARLEESSGHWDGASAAYRRLVALEEDPSLVVATALRLADACERAGRVGDARGGLERARMVAPEDETLRQRLELLYEQTGCWRELAQLALEDAQATGDVGGRFQHLMRAGTLLLSNGDAEGAISPLRDAHTLRPNDADCIVRLADACLATGFVKQAIELLDDAIALHKGRRSKELAALYHRRARVARLAGDEDQEMRWLALALDVDPQSGVVASELAELALRNDQLDLANRALRAVTMLKVPGPMSRARAYQYMGEIARRQGDVRKAVVLLKRAISEDASLTDARTLLDALQQD